MKFFVKKIKVILLIQIFIENFINAKVGQNK
jgi:hypothetical protein